jgi:hypothetical protein
MNLSKIKTVAHLFDVLHKTEQQIAELKKIALEITLEGSVPSITLECNRPTEGPEEPEDTQLLNNSLDVFNGLFLRYKKELQNIHASRIQGPITEQAALRILAVLLEEKMQLRADTALKIEELTEIKL